MRKRAISLFGAGQRLSLYFQMMKLLGYEIDAIVDNNKDKIGQYFDGVLVSSPEKLLDLESEIIITCLAKEEIYEQLLAMGIQDRIVEESTILVQELKNSKQITNKKNSLDDNWNVVFDTVTNAKWGGAEFWNLYVSKAFSKLHPVYIQYGGKLQIGKEYCPDENYHHLRIKSNDQIAEAYQNYQNLKNVIFIGSNFGKTFVAATIYKIRNPKKCKIIYVVHNDLDYLYQQCQKYGDFIDQYICISTRMKNRLVESYHVPSQKICFWGQPIEHITEDKFNVVIHFPIRIAMASRLEKLQKRCDLIPRLIQKIEATGIDYRLSIAGDGEYRPVIEAYIKENQLSDHVSCVGYVQSSQMCDYWQANDVYINISEQEGTSLAMLEAMSNYCIPIVTDVSGANDYIKQYENGYICDVGDIDGIVASIVKLLTMGPEQILYMKQEAHNSISEKCNLDGFIERLFITIFGKGGVLNG